MISDIHDTDYDPNDSFHQLTGQSKRRKSVSKQARLQQEDEEVIPAFSVLISVERAMHLPRVSEHSRSGEKFNVLNRCRCFMIHDHPMKYHVLSPVRQFYDFSADPGNTCQTRMYHTKQLSQTTQLVLT